MRISGECDRRLFWGIVWLWGLVCFFFFIDFLFWRGLVLLIEILFYMYRSLPHRLRPKRRSEIFWCVFGGDSFDGEWTLYFDVAGE